jgi:succinate dehydrogenase/fumarate reductase flavoprotein subunit
VEAGFDADYEKANIQYKLENPPFYAAWCTPCTTTPTAACMVNEHCQVMDRWGNVIPGLYAGGEVAGGWSEHGLGKCVVMGYIAGDHAARS